jgi:hypothetical protein
MSRRWESRPIVQVSRWMPPMHCRTDEEDDLMSRRFWASDVSWAGNGKVGYGFGWASSVVRKKSWIEGLSWGV